MTVKSASGSALETGKVRPRGPGADSPAFNLLTACSYKTKVNTKSKMKRENLASPPISFEDSLHCLSLRPSGKMALIVASQAFTAACHLTSATQGKSDRWSPLPGFAACQLSSFCALRATFDSVEWKNWSSFLKCPSAVAFWESFLLVPTAPHPSLGPHTSYLPLSEVLRSFWMFSLPVVISAPST